MFTPGNRKVHTVWWTRHKIWSILITNQNINDEKPSRVGQEILRTDSCRLSLKKNFKKIEMIHSIRD